MSYFHCETPAWVDPYLLKRASDEHLLDDDDEEQRVIKKKLTEMAKRRDACSVPRDPKTDKASVVTPQYVAHPIEFRANTAGDRNAPQHFTLVAVSNNTFVGVTKNNMIHFFDQTNDIPITSISMLGQTPMDERTLTLQQKLANAATAGAAGVLNSMNIPGVTPTATSTNFVDAKDVATKLFLDSMGRYAVVVFQSGVNLLYHIKRSDAHEDDAEETEKEKKKKKKEKKKKGKKDNDAKDKPQRFDIALTPEVTGGASSFSIESIGWDEHNSYESGSGEVILASQKHGILVACRFESSGVAGARHLFTFPAPLNKQPIHSVAMTREQEGQKRACILVSMDHKLFFFRSHNSTLETAFILADLTVPDNDAEAAYLAAAGSASGGTLPLKNFWALPVQSPVISSAASQSSKHSSPAELVHPPVSKVTIHSPHRSYTDEQLPLTFTWTYHDTVVQGVLMPFPANVTGTAGARGQTGIQESSTLARSSAAAAISNRRKDHLRNAQSGAGDSSVDCLQVMMDSMRIVHVENCSMLVAAAEYALQFDAESAAPPFNAPPPTVGAVPTPVTPLVRSGSFASPQHSRGAALTSPTSATNMVYALQHERVVRVHATYFYLTIVTQTKLYIFASVPCVPLPSSTSPWEVRNRLIYTHSLSSTQAPPPTVVLQREGTVRDYSNAPKLPPLLYKADSCLEVIRDVKYINKLYLCVAKEIIELPLPSMKRTFAVLLMQYAVATGKKITTPPPTALTITQRHFPSSTGSSGPAAAEKKDQGCHLDGNTISKLATTNSVFCMLPWTPVTGVSDEAVVQGGAPGTRSRSGTVLRPQLQRSSGTGGGSAMKPLQKQSGARQLELPTYTTSSAMKLYGASRFPIRPGMRSHALPTDVLFHVALSLSAKQPKLRKMVQNTFGELLFSQERYLEAAAWLGRYSTQGADEWFTRFTFLCNTPSHGVLPLLLFCLVRARIITDSGNSMFGAGVVAVSCLSAAALVLLLDRCNAVRDAELLLASSFTTTLTSTSTKPLSSLSTAIQSHHRLTNPAELLAELLKTQKDLLPWSVVQEALFRVGSEDQVFTVCRTMDKLQDLLQYLLNHGRYFDALQLVIERSKHEANDEIKRIERKRDAQQVVTDELIAALRTEIVGLKTLVDQTADALERAESEAAHAERESKRLLAENDKLQREMSSGRRQIQEGLGRENTLSTKLAHCETLRSDLEMDALELRRSNDLLLSEVRQLHARDESMELLQKENEKNVRRWRDIEASHKQQVHAFHHHDHDGGEASVEQVEEDPHPDIDSPRFFSQLKAQEEAYRAEMHRRREVETQSASSRADL
ncbi:Hypothetical protein, putative [Bodo saltans]|uniref:Pep3/Vps18 beta-propeller domain-containing protein n=1 Tax=Bodo saltans TaxID=75058 RepID=A0A0S4JAJ2_BODSA|nr:Hypothetical protein, putative [Bodo saltans]|eukprot:CUG86144.1 Hypothetical protein, putative [Bodo saltans]